MFFTYMDFPARKFCLKAINPLRATSFLLYPLKTENIRFFDVSKGYRKRPVA